MLSSPTAESKLLHWRHGMWSLRSMDGANTLSAGSCELRNQSCRRTLAGWRLHRPDSPRREARRFARDTAHEATNRRKCRAPCCAATVLGGSVHRSADADSENGMVEQIVRLSELVRIARDIDPGGVNRTQIDFSAGARLQRFSARSTPGP
jgi:hypothetical protein